MRNFSVHLLLAAIIAAPLNAEAKDYVVTSPDSHLYVTINDDAALTWSISRDSSVNKEHPDTKTDASQIIMLPSPIGITTDSGVWGEAGCIRSSSTRSISRTIKAVAY